MLRASLIVALLFASSAFADVTIRVNETWTNATTNVDGSPITDAQYTNFYYTAPSGWEHKEIVEDPNLLIQAASFTFDVPSGEVISVRATHEDGAGNESVLSVDTRTRGPFFQEDVIAQNPPSLAGPGENAEIVACPKGYVCSQ